MRWLGFALLVLGLAPACGRHTLTARKDGGGDALPDQRADLPAADEPLGVLGDAEPDGVPDLAQPDAAPDQPDAAPGLRDIAPDQPDAAADPRDAGADRAMADTAGPEVAPADGPAGMVACGALAPLAARGVLTALRSRQVVFARDRSFVALRVRGDEMDAGSGPDWLVRVGLPSGKIETLSRAGGTAEALGPSGLLVVGADGGTGLAVYDGGGLRPVAAGVCGHRASPDGRWIYVVRDCDTDNRGTLDVIDVTGGTTSTLARNALALGLAVSPGGTYAAFVVSPPDASPISATNVINVATVGGKTYALSSDPGASNPWFASDSLLLFSTGSSFGPSMESIRGHVPPDTASTYLVAEGRSPSLFGYKLSPDGEWLLAAGEQANDGGSWPTGLLYSIRTDGGGEHLLTSDLLPYWQFAMALDAFAWTGDGTRAVFTTNESRGVGANDRLGTSPSGLSDYGTFRTAPAGDRVALLEYGDAGPSHMRLVAAGSGRDVASFASDKSVGGANFLPDGQALLFVNYPAAGPVELRRMGDDGTTVLATWSSTLLAMDGGKSGLYSQPYGSYPVDPTGCFTVVDTDLAPGPGTRLVLLKE